MLMLPNSPGNAYRRLFSALPLPPVAAEIAFRTVEVPFYTASPFDAYGFVPALIPLWATDSPSYTGCWKHWLTPQRQPTFVELFLENEARPAEIARSFSQLTQRMALTAVNLEGRITPEIEQFARHVGISSATLLEIDSVSETSGDSDGGLLLLPSFSENPPLACCQDRGEKYPGDFPHDAITLTKEALRSVCTFEVSQEMEARLRQSPLAPPWFTTKDQPQLFADLLRRGDLQGAWMSLNSTGWGYLQAKEALRQLGKQADDPAFHLLVEAWTAEPHENNSVTRKAPTTETARRSVSDRRAAAKQAQGDYLLFGLLAFWDNQQSHALGGNAEGQAAARDRGVGEAGN